MKKIKGLCVLSLIIIMIVTGCMKKGKPKASYDEVAVRVGGLKGPTSIGLAGLINENKTGKTICHYDDFVMAAAADEITAKFVAGDLDIILVPANVASVLYNKTNGNVVALDINTLGVLYMVTANDALMGGVKEDGSYDMSLLKGQTIILTGKGTTPDYVLQYLLGSSGIDLDDVTLEYKSEATEVVAALEADKDAIGLLPQPFVTVALSKNEALKVIVDTTMEWEKSQGNDGGKLVTGVTIARKDFLEEHPLVAEQFLKDHSLSTELVQTDLDKVAGYVVDLGIIANEGVAKKAIPNCNIVCIAYDDMQKSLSSYLKVLYDLNPKAVGGVLPGDDFYYLGTGK